jgi:hypothetical protein
MVAATPCSRRDPSIPHRRRPADDGALRSQVQCAVVGGHGGGDHVAVAEVVGIGHRQPGTILGDRRDGGWPTSTSEAARHPYTRRLIAAVPTIRRALADVQAAEPSRGVATIGAVPIDSAKDSS